MIQGIHKIKTMLLSTFLPTLHKLRSLTQESTNYDYKSAEYRFAAIISDATQYRLFRPVRSLLKSTDAKTHFIRLNLVSKGMYVVNLPPILESKSVIETVPSYFK